MGVSNIPSSVQPARSESGVPRHRDTGWSSPIFNLHNLKSLQIEVSRAMLNLTQHGTYHNNIVT
jgi:hypothetical protein